MTPAPLNSYFAQQAGQTAAQRHSLSLCWHGEKVGSFEVSGKDIKWEGYTDPKFSNLFTKRESDGMPYFLVNMHPDNELYELLDQDDQVTYITGGLRFLSNIVISKNCPFDQPVKMDQLQTDFGRHIQDGTFNGTYTGPFPIDTGEGLADQLKDYWRNRYVPRFSGAEIKVPATLHEYGVLQPAITTPFTHIIKLPGGNGREGWGFNEWMCLELSEAAGLRTAKHALLPLGKGRTPAILVERFDIPGQARNVEHNQFLIQDFCTLAEMGPEDRGKGSMEQIAKVMRQVSTNPQADIEDLFRRSILSVAVSDTDMHRKNIAMLFEYSPREQKFVSVRMSPSYDITSDIWEADVRKKQVLTINAKDRALTVKAFMGFAKFMGIEENRAREILETTSQKIAERAIQIAGDMPDEAKIHDSCQLTAKRIATMAVEFVEQMGLTPPAWEKVKAPKTAAIIENGERAVVDYAKRPRRNIDYM